MLTVRALNLAGRPRGGQARYKTFGHPIFSRLRYGMGDQLMKALVPDRSDLLRTRVRHTLYVSSILFGSLPQWSTRTHSAKRGLGWADYTDG